MGSGLIYAAIVAIWGLLLVPMWMRKHESDQKISEVAKFTNAMASLSDAFLPAPRRTPTVTAKRAVRTGLADPDRRRRLQLRRRAFSAVLMLIPVSVIAVVVVHMSLAVLLTPFVAFALFTAWVRSDMRPRKVSRTPDVREVNTSVRTKNVAAHRHSTLRASLAAISRTATEKLLETKPQVDTATTEAWQETETALSEMWTAPEAIVPTYVNAPAASSVPREIDRQHGEWNASAMLEAAARQKSLADLVAAVQIEETSVQPLLDVDRTTELPHIASA